MKLSAFRTRALVHCCILVFLLTLFPSLVIAQQKQPKKLNIAVLDFDSRGAMTKNEAGSLSDIFQSYLVDAGEFIVVDRARIRTLMAEVGFQESGVCSDVECVVEAGKILKVEKMFAGTIGKVGKIYSINIQMINVATARIEINKSRQYDGNVEGIAGTVIPEIVEEILTQMTGREVKVRRISFGTSWLWYAGGAILIGGGVAAYLLLKPSETQQPKSLPVPPTLPQ
jgi:hypothetical protein